MYNLQNIEAVDSVIEKVSLMKFFFFYIQIFNDLVFFKLNFLRIVL